MMGLVLFAPLASAQRSGDAAVPAGPVHEPRLEAMERLFERGVSMVEQQRWAEALELFRRARRLGARPSIVENIAFILTRLGRHREALQAYEELVGMAGVDDATRQRATLQRRRLRRRLSVLELTVAPDSARVEVAGELIFGTGPRRVVVLDPGDHRVSVSANGYAPQRIEVSALPGEQIERTVELTPEQATLVVSANVPSAEIRVDGSVLGRGEVTRELAPGLHDVVVSAPGRGAFARTVELPPGERVRISAMLGADEPIVESAWFWGVLGGALALVLGVSIGVGVAVSESEQLYGGSTGVVLMAVHDYRP
jgi:PEGA domain-containing protein